jgi:chloramphenicol-sensitive protein RarD
MNSFKSGVALAVLSYFVWGLLPLFWKLLLPVAPLQILAFRILCSLLFVGIIITRKNGFVFLKQFADKRERFFIIAAALFITVNWGLFIWAINSGHTIQTSLGYYINPLFSIVLGLIFFREKLSPLQWVAFASAAAGVIILTFLTGFFPWTSLVLALTFSIYGLLKKKISVRALEGLALETLAAAPIALILLFAPLSSVIDEGALFGSLRSLMEQGAFIWVLLALAGPATAIPLLFFSAAAQRIPLSSLGFIQFISPTLTLFLGIFIFSEPFPKEQLAGFIFVWAAVILYSISLFFNKRTKRA